MKWIREEDVPMAQDTWLILHGRSFDESDEFVGNETLMGKRTTDPDGSNRWVLSCHKHMTSGECLMASFDVIFWMPLPDDPTEQE